MFVQALEVPAFRQIVLAWLADEINDGVVELATPADGLTNEQLAAVTLRWFDGSGYSEAQIIDCFH